MHGRLIAKRPPAQHVAGLELATPAICLNYTETQTRVPRGFLQSFHAGFLAVAVDPRKIT